MSTELEEKVKAAFGDKEARPEKQVVIWELLNRLKSHHLPTYEHSLRVGLKAMEIAMFMHILPRTALHGVLHDIGKLEIPLRLLNISKGYDAQDHQIMMRHPEIGYFLLMEKGLPMSAWIALTHHRFQGNPYPEELPAYPEQLKTNNAHLTADLYGRIVSIADQYDALHRENDMHGETPINSQQIRKNLIIGNSDQTYLIDELYRHKILLEDSNQIVNLPSL